MGNQKYHVGDYVLVKTNYYASRYNGRAGQIINSDTAILEVGRIKANSQCYWIKIIDEKYVERFLETELTKISLNDYVTESI